MPSRREIARDWHVAKSWIDRCVAELGCPGSSLEEARKWREENSRRSVATYQRSIARQIEEEEDSNSPEARIQKAKAYTEYGTSMRCSECQPLKIDIARVVATPRFGLRRTGIFRRSRSTSPARWTQRHKRWKRGGCWQRRCGRRCGDLCVRASEEGHQTN